MRDILKTTKKRPEGMKVPSTAGRNSGEAVVEYGFGKSGGTTVAVNAYTIETQNPT